MVSGSEQGTWGNGEGVKSPGRGVVRELPFLKQRINLRGWRRHVSGGSGPPDGIFSCSHLGSLGVGEEKTDGWDGWTDPKLGNYQVDVAEWQRVRTLGCWQESGWRNAPWSLGWMEEEVKPRRKESDWSLSWADHGFTDGISGHRIQQSRNSQCRGLWERWLVPNLEARWVGLYLEQPESVSPRTKHWARGALAVLGWSRKLCQAHYCNVWSTAERRIQINVIS